jgi:hypothetical protein
MDNSLLLGQEFEVDLFLHKLATSASLTDIRDDVNEYHSKLKQELVKLINDDYHDFISITTSIDPKLIIALTHPLPILKQQVEQVRSDLALVQSNFLSKLTQRANLRDQKVCSHTYYFYIHSFTPYRSLYYCFYLDYQTRCPV